MRAEPEKPGIEKALRPRSPPFLIGEEKETESGIRGGPKALSGHVEAQIKEENSVSGRNGRLIQSYLTFEYVCVCVDRRGDV